MPKLKKKVEPETPRRDAHADWALGAYHRAYILTKSRRNVDAALRLLEQLYSMTEPARDGDLVDGATVFALRVQRRYGLALLRAGDPRGRDELLDLLARLGGRDADAPSNGGPLARLLSDFCADLSNIACHEEAVEIAKRVAAREISAHREARRLGNVAAWMLQRAVYARLSGDADGAAPDLKDALVIARDAVRAHEKFVAAGAAYEAMPFRESRAIELSVRSELVQLGEHDDELPRELSELIAATERAESWEESYIQKAYRVGRLGVTHLQYDRERDAAWRARIYLQLAWDSLGNALMRPWLPVALRDAMLATDDAPGAAVFARIAADRLAVQCSAEHPAVRLLRAAA